MAVITALSLLGYDELGTPILLKLCQVGWGVSLHSYFQVSPEMFDRVQVRALDGALKDIQRLVRKPLLHCLGCLLSVVGLFEGKSSPPSLRS